MKYIIGFIICISGFFPSFSFANNSSNVSDTVGKEAPLVKVIRWNSRGIYLLGGYFTEIKDEIIQQTSRAEFEQIEEHSSLAGWPAEFYVTIGNEDSIAAKMNQLKMYKIAAYQHKYNGEVFEREVILRVPYEENKNWDPTVKWEGNAYFILKENDIEVL